jgi:hypothetical protein
MRLATVPPKRLSVVFMNPNAPFITAAQSSGSIRSAREVERTTSANKSVASFRSPSIGRGTSSAEPQWLQNRAPSDSRMRTTDRRPWECLSVHRYEGRV